ncbi:MAG: superoxide dismutase, Fe-Mn family [Candidatus Peregrinibacteria bacterium Gr01-1014_25]|nr:MAG: superoxide dismutase, Fe-Mn family [Candidatus Peregrinibacteria bacterium Gr01-1014_25]
MHTLPPLPYAYDALEPHIDARTMEIHHTKHHQAYVDKLNAAVKGSEWEAMPVDELLRNFAKIPVAMQTAVRNHGGGHSNHSLFWTVIGPNAGGKPGGALAKAMDETFGDFASFQQTFTATAAGVFGSGWAWMGFNEEGKLHIGGTPNQDSPLVHGHTPILGLDVWEHAYYLKYQNKRPDYITAFWNVVNWKEVERRFDAGKR